jgi:DNA-binding ferritin-like protein
MIPILIQLRSMQLYAHHAHNLCARIVFMQDHEFFGDAYGVYETDYDGVIERIIGTKGDDGLELSSILLAVSSKLKEPMIGVKENKVFYTKLISMENELRVLIGQEIKAGVSEGTRQMLGDICDRSEVRCYKIQQRLK